MIDRIIATKHSWWTFDTDRHLYVRHPRKAGAGHPNIDYDPVWEPYVAVVPHDGIITVFRPVLWGQGCVRNSGEILSDSHEGEPWDVPDPERLMQLNTPARDVYRDMV